MPAAPSASSIAGSCALVRTRMAIAPWAVPDRASARIAPVIPASSASPVANPPISGAGPDDRLATRRLAGRAAAPGGRSSTRASPRGQDAVGERQDLGRGAVVRLEGHHPRRRIAVGERDQVLARRPGEGVDRLVLVTDHGQVVAPAEPRLEERCLERIGVLVLVDREPAVAVADLGRDRRVRVDQSDRQLEHVLEVDPTRPDPWPPRSVGTGRPSGPAGATRRGPRRSPGARTRPAGSAGPWPIRSPPRGHGRRGSDSRRAGPWPTGRGSAPWIRGWPVDPSRGRAARNVGAGGARPHGTSTPRRPAGPAPRVVPASRPPPCR